MDNGGSLISGTLAASTTASAASSTTASIYSTNVAFAPLSDGEENHGPTVFATTIVFLALATVSVLLRIIARAVIVGKMRIDDYLIIAAYVLSFGMCISICFGVHYGFGRHSIAIPLIMAYEKQKYQYAFTLLYNPAIAVTKVSILAFYLLVFKVQRHFRRFCWITMGVIILAGVVLTFTLAFRCKPISLAFNPDSNRAPFPGCIGTVRIYFASAPVNILTALAIIVLPIPILTTLRLPTRQKAILVFVFSLGVFDIVVGIIRIHYFQLSENQVLDFDYNAAYSFMWAAIEVNVGILCACIPMSKPLISKFFPTWLGSVSLSEGNRESTQYEPTYAPGTMVRRNTIGSMSRRPSIGIGWLSAYGDSHGGTIGELGHVEEDGRIVSPTRGMRRPHPANRLEAELWEDNDILVKTPPVAMPRIPEHSREQRYGSLGDSGMSGSTAVARHSETESFFEKIPSGSKSQTPPWEKMDLPDIASEDFDPLDKRGLPPNGPNSNNSDGSASTEVPPWEKLDLPGFNESPIDPDPSSKGKKSTVQFGWRRSGLGGRSSKRSSGISSPSSPQSPTMPQTAADIFKPREHKSKPGKPSIAIPDSNSKSPSPGSPKLNLEDDEDVSPTNIRGASLVGDEDISPKTTRGMSRTTAQPLIPPTEPSPSLQTPQTSKSIKSSSSSSAKSGESPLGARKEAIDVGELANEKEIVQAPDDAITPIVETPPWEKMDIADVSGKARMQSAQTSTSAFDSVRPSPARYKSAESSLLRDVITREQYEKIGSVIDPTTPNSGITTPAWAREDELREDHGDTPPAVIGTNRGTFRIGETPPRERKLREYFGEENIGAYIDIGPAKGSSSTSPEDRRL